MKSLSRFISNQYVLLFLIFILALFLRLYALGTVPFGFHMDEVANTFIGRFILQNGVDIYGNKFPLLYFNKFGDYPPVLPMYLSGLGTYFFGINIFAARFGTAILGALTVIPIFFIFKFFINKTAGIIGALMLAILPWHIILSRSSAEGVTGFFASLSGLALVLYAIRNKKIILLFLSWLFLGLSYLLYPSFRILIPLVLLPLPILFWKTKETRVFSLVTLGLFVLITGYIAVTPWGKGRYDQTALLSSPRDAAIVQDKIQMLTSGETDIPVPLVRFFHNKPVVYGQWFTQLYLDYYSPQFLFFNNIFPQRYRVPDVSLVYITSLIFLVFLLFFPRIAIKKKVYAYFFYLLCVAVLPAALTIEDSPNLHRAIPMIFPIIFFLTIAIINFQQVVSSFKKPIGAAIALLVIFIFIAELLFDTNQYIHHAGNNNAFYRNDGNVQLATYLVQEKNTYPRLIVPQKSWMPLYYLFAKNDFNKTYIGQFGNDFTINSIDNLIFYTGDCPSLSELHNKRNIDVSAKDIIIQNGDCPVENYKTKDIIKRVDGTNAYKVTQLNN